MKYCLAWEKQAYIQNATRQNIQLSYVVEVEDIFVDRKKISDYILYYLCLVLQLLLHQVWYEMTKNLRKYWTVMFLKRHSHINLD